MNLVYQLYSTIDHHFPQLFNWMRKVDDCRKKASDYELAAHLTACLALFLFKEGSRNNYNQKRKNLQFQENDEKLFGFPLPLFGERFMHKGHFKWTIITPKHAINPIRKR